MAEKKGKIGKEEIINTLKEMSSLEISELVTELEESFGVTAAAPMAVAPAAGGQQAQDAQAEEKTQFDVVLQSIGDKKIQVIKVVRACTSLGLKEAKDIVEAAPKAIKEAIPKEEAEKVKKDLEEAGATAEIK